MKLERLKEIIHIVEEANVDVLHIEEDGFTLYYEKNGGTPVVQHTNNQSLEEVMPTAAETTTDIEKDDMHEEIVSPMIGTFYSRPEPGQEPYVQVGETVTEGETVCVLEAMKLMNDITAAVTGEIVEVLAEDGDVIEYGQPLFKVRVGA